MVLKEKAYRGSRRLFEVYITDLDGNPQDPDSCQVIFQKIGEYSYDSPRGPFTCAKTGSTGYWGYHWTIPGAITLGDWVARFEWSVLGSPGDTEMFFTLRDYIRPYLSKPDLSAGSEVIG